MDVEVRLRGRSCESSVPERGDNPIARMANLIQEVEQLNRRLKHDAFLGNGSIAVTGSAVRVAIAWDRAERLHDSFRSPFDGWREPGRARWRRSARCRARSTRT